jgi:hypothetical protein
MTDAAFLRDANRVPITNLGVLITNPVTLTGSGTTINLPIFRVTGSVLILALYGVITTDLQNHTAASWRLNDQGAQIYITAVGGTSLTNKKAGSVIVKKDVVSAALTLLDNTNGVISEPTTLETDYFSPFVMVKKTGALNTDIEYNYTTSDTPTHGAIQFFVGFVPLSAEANIAAV